MDKILLGFIFLLSALSCSRLQVLDLKQTPRITLQEFEKNAPRYTRHLIDEKKSLLIRIPKDQPIPVKIKTAVAYAELAFEKSTLSFKEEIWLYLSVQGIYLSREGKSWAPLYDLKALNELYGQKSGALSLSFGADPDKGAAIHIYVQTYTE